MSTKIDVHYGNNKTMKLDADYWKVNDNGLLIIEKHVGEIPYKTVFASGEWSHIIEHAE